MISTSVDFTCATGKARKDTWQRRDAWIVPLTDELRAHIELQNRTLAARDKLQAFSPFKWASVTDDKVLACAAILWPEDFKP